MKYAQLGIGGNNPGARSRRSTARLWRWLAAAVPAAAVTAGLFLAMNHVVGVEVMTPEVREPRPLESVTPQRDQLAESLTVYTRPARIESAQLPPPPPPVRGQVTDSDLPVVVVAGASGPEALKPIAQQDVVLDRTLQPIRPPVPSYPATMARRGIEGECEVRFSVNQRGQPFDISAMCTDPGFEPAAERAVARNEFAPQIVRGRAVEQHGVVYPLTFRLSQ